MDVLMEAAIALASDRPLLVTLRRLVDLTVGRTEAARGAMITVDRDGGLLACVASGPSERRQRLWRPPLTAGGVLDALLQNPTPRRLHRVAIHPASLGFPSNHPTVGSLLGSQVRALGQCYGCIYLVDKAGQRDFTDDDERVLVAVAAQAGVALANVRLHWEVTLNEAWRVALDRVAAAVQPGPEAPQPLAEVATAARALADADLALVIGAGCRRGTFRVLAADGTAARRLLGLPARPGPRSFRMIADVSLHEAPVSRLPRMAAGVVVPMRTRTWASETLWVMRTPRRPAFGLVMAGLVGSFAEHAAVLLDQAWSRPNGERGTRELHDDVVQSLFGVGMELQAAAMRVREDELSSRLTRAASNLDWIINRMRSHDEGSG